MWDYGCYWSWSYRVARKKLIEPFSFQNRFFIFDLAGHPLIWPGKYLEMYTNVSQIALRNFRASAGFSFVRNCFFTSFLHLVISDTCQRARRHPSRKISTQVLVVNQSNYVTFSRFCATSNWPSFFMCTNPWLISSFTCSCEPNLPPLPCPHFYQLI